MRVRVGALGLAAQHTELVALGVGHGDPPPPPSGGRRSASELAPRRKQPLDVVGRPSCSARLRRCWLTSVTVTVSAPYARAVWPVTSPIGAAPVTSTVLPGASRPRRHAQTPDRHGFQQTRRVVADAPRDGYTNAASIATNSANAPSWGGVAKNGTSGQRVVAIGQGLTAGAAGHPRLDRHPLPHLQRRDLTPHGRHDASRLVPKDQGRVHRVRTDPAVLVVVHVGAAHPDRPDFDQHLVSGRLGNAALFDVDLPDAAQHAHLHRRHAGDVPNPVRAIGVHADLSGVLLDARGAAVETPLSGRIIGITAGQLRRIPDVIGIAYGPDKVSAAPAAIRGGYLNGLVTHTEFAQHLLTESA